VREVAAGAADAGGLDSSSRPKAEILKSLTPGRKKQRMTTVLNALQSAQGNFETIGRLGAKSHPIFVIALDQLSNAVKALENGKAPNDVLQG